MLITIRENQRLRRYFLDGKDGLITSLPYFDIDLINFNLQYKNSYYGQIYFKDQIEFEIFKKDIFYTIKIKIFLKDFSFDIIYDDKIFIDNQFKIIKNKIIAEEFFVNGILNDRKELKKSDIIDYQDYRIIYFDNFYIVNNIKSDNKQSVIKNNPLTDLQTIEYDNFELKKLKLTLKKLPPKIQKNKINLLLNIGPSITMIFISLMTYMINFYFNKEQKINLIFILTPIFMGFSISFWQILNYSVNNKNYKYNSLKRKDSYFKNIEILKNELIEYNEYLFKLFKKIKLNDNFNYLIDDNFYIPLGNYQNKINDYLINIDLDENDDIIKDIKICLNKYLTIDNYLYYFNFFNFQVINVINDNNQKVFLHLYYYLSKIKNIAFSIYIDEKLPSFIYRDSRFIYNNKRMINQHFEVADKLVIFNFSFRKIKKNKNIYIINFNNFDENAFNIEFKNDYYFKIDNLKIRAILKDNIILNNNSKKNYQNNIIRFKDIHKQITSNEKGLIAYLGKNKYGDIIELDLSQDKSGPHGLIAGTTGSGKTELLLSLCLSLAYRYSPEYLNLVIIDFKGGGLIECLKYQNINLPHLVSEISNLDGFNFEKIITSFKNECIKRQQYFKKASIITNTNILNLEDYYQNGFKDLAHLIIIIDEFAELKKEHPEFIQEIISISRIGRSLGMHLILCTQKPTGVVDDQIKSNTNFKICLKVNSEIDSKEIIDSADAYFIENIGEFYLKFNNKLIKGKSIYSNTNLKNSDNFKVELLDNQLEIIDEIKIETNKNLLESKLIVNEIYHKYIDFKADNYQLWLSKLESISILKVLNKINKNNLTIGVYDDFKRKVQNFVELKLTKHSLIVFDGLISLKHFLYNVVNVLNISKVKHILISSFNLDFNIFKNSYLELLEINDFNKIEILIKILKYQPQKLKDTVIIFDSFQNIIEILEIFKVNFNVILKQANLYNFKIILCNNSSLNINYQLLLMFDEKIVLGNISKNEYFNLFYKNLTPLKNKNEGYCLIDDLYFFKLFNFDLFKININIPKLIEPILEKIDFKVQKNKLFIGIDNDKLEDIYVELDEKLIILSYDDKLLQYFKTIYINFTNIEILNFKTLNIDKVNDLLNYKILFVGSGYSNQFYFNTKIKKELNKGEAILIENNESRLLKYVNQKD